MEPQLTPQDREHLNVLSICFYVYGGLQVLFGFVPGIYVFMGSLMLNDPALHRSGAPPMVEAMPWIFIAVGILASLYIWTVATLMFFTASGLRARKRHVLCIIGSALILLNMPLGTALGVFSLIVLLRPSVKAAFTRPEAFPEHNAPYPPTI
ncbi:MAG: hypothetical protein AB7K71_16170 [Polyangiaceae bacterium]